MTLRARGAQLGEATAVAMRARIAARVGDELPGVMTTIDSDRVVLTGRGLRARLLSEPVLRWIGSLVR